MTTSATETLDPASLQALLGPQLRAEQAALIFQQGQEAVVSALLTLAKQLAEKPAASAAAADPSAPSGQTLPYAKPASGGRANPRRSDQGADRGPASSRFGWLRGRAREQRKGTRNVAVGDPPGRDRGPGGTAQGPFPNAINVLFDCGCAALGIRDGPDGLLQRPVDIRVGHRNDRGYSVRPSHVQLSVRWLVLTAWVAGLDAAAINWTIAARKFIPMGGIGSGEGVSIGYRGHDGSQGYVFQSYVTGKTTVHRTHPPTRMGLCYVWWAAVAGGLLTLVALALAATRNGRRLIVEFPLRRMTTQRWMIAVAVIGIEAGLIIGAMRCSGVDPRSSRWPPILIYIAAFPTLVLLRAFGRPRSAGAEMNSFGANSESVNHGWLEEWRNNRCESW